MGDARRAYIVGVLTSLWGPQMRLSETKASDDALSKFLDDPQCRALHARLLHRPGNGAKKPKPEGDEGKDNNEEEAVRAGDDGDDSGEIFLSTHLEREDSTGSDQQVGQQQAQVEATTTFVKLSGETILPGNMRKQIQVTSVRSQAPVQCLYESVHQVYAPLLLRDDGTARMLSQKLKDALQDLDSGLASALLLQADDSRAGGSNSGKGVAIGKSGDAGTNLMAIVTVADECRYWEQQQGDPRNAKRARKFTVALDTVAPRFARLLDTSFDEMLELLDDTQNALDDIWRADVASREQQYPQVRMDHVLSLVGAAVNSFVLDKAAATRDFDLWTSPLHDVARFLQQAVGLCDKWGSAVETLTLTLWPAVEEHPWIAIPSSSASSPLTSGDTINYAQLLVQRLAQRLEHLLKLRTTFEELSSLLPREKRRALAVACFAPFASLQPLYYNPYTESLWKRAVAAFESALAPVEFQVGAVLREQLALVAARPGAAVRFLQRYLHLLERPTLASTLSTERDALLAQLLAHVDQLDSDFEARRQASSSLSLSTGKSSSMHVGKTLSPEVNAIVWAQTLGTRLRELLVLARCALRDLPAFTSLSRHCEQLSARVHGFVLDKVRDWQDVIERQLDEDGERALRLRGRLMQIDARTGELIVNYSEFLVTLLRDVRQLSELSAQQRQLQLQYRADSNKDGDINSGGGVSVDEWVPERVRKVAEEAEKYYRFGVTLKKVANFYNNMEAQIIDEQKPMLLDALLAFEAVVQSPNAGTAAQQQGSKSPSKSSSREVTWQNLDECDEYVKQLQDAADRLAAENRRFKRVHEKLGEELVLLMDVDLLRYPSRWKERWDDIKKVVTQATRKQDPARTKRWFLFWDHQVYKVLESGYQLGLEMLNENLPEIKEIRTELHLAPVSSSGSSSTSTVLSLPTSSSSSFMLKPPIEELRTAYYKAMKKFVARPTKFSGFANPDVFVAMCDANAGNLVRVYGTCEQLFSRVEALVADYESWGAVLMRLAGGDDALDALLETELHECADWELNLKTVRAKRKESDKIPDSVRIDCVLVSLVPFKRSLDELLGRFQDTLLLSLRRSALKHIKAVEDFVDAAMDSLNRRPHSIEEIADAQREWKTIDNDRPAAHVQLGAAEKKKTLLLNAVAVSNASSLDTSEVETRLAQLPTRWENFEIALEAFNDMIEEQREHLKGEIAANVIECNLEIDRFRQRWNVLRPIDVASWEDEAIAKVYTAMADWRAKLSDLESRSTALAANCAAFGLDEPAFNGLAVLAADVAKLDHSWQAYQQFREEVRAIAAMDWITYCCTNVFALQDCAQKWFEQTKQLPVPAPSQTPSSPRRNSEAGDKAPSSSSSSERSAVASRINDFFGSVKRAMPAFKLCRGEPFKDDHWTQLFRKLGLPRGVEKHNLTVGHFLDAFSVLEQPATLQFVKTLHARAQGEVTIREALQELRAWTETAELSLLMPEEDTGGANSGRPCVPIIKDWKDLTLALGDNQSLLASLKESQFFKPFEGEAAQFESKMTILDQALSQLNIIQRKWVFLAPIFAKGALPAEQPRFRKVDDEFTTIMTTVERDPKLFNLTDDMLFPQLLDRLAMMVDQLERCQKALADFLEEKRARMPRFYFIGDEDLVCIRFVADGGERMCWPSNIAHECFYTVGDLGPIAEPCSHPEPPQEALPRRESRRVFSVGRFNSCNAELSW
jgi:dynein heavy chain 2